MLGALNDFLLGAIWLAAVIGFGVTGWQAVHSAHFRAVSESYYGRKAQGLGGACLLLAVVAGIFLLQRILVYVAVGLAAGLFFLLGAALGGYLMIRYYRRA